MIIHYKNYKSSFLATGISIISGLFKAVVVLMVLFSIHDIRTFGFSGGKLHEFVIIGVICYLVTLVLDRIDKDIAEKKHIKKLHNNFKYAKRFVAENPEAHEYCMENNKKYAEFYANRESV